MKKNAILITISLLIFSLANAQQWQKEVFGNIQDGSKMNFFEIQKRADVYFKDVKEEIEKEVSAEENFEGNTDPMHRAYFEYQRWRIENAFLVKEDGSLVDPIEAHNEYQSYLDKSSMNTRVLIANWKNINRTNAPGGYWGMGATRNIQFHPTDVNTFWLAADGGIWKTTNGGNTYTPVGDNLPWLKVGSICVDPTKTNTIYACTGNYLSWDYDRSIGVYKTTDGGVTWKPTGVNSNLIDKISYSTLVMSPANPKILLVGCLSNNASKGIYRTTDGGTTWTHVLSSQTIKNIAFDPTNGNIVYAGANSNSGSIYRSTDGGVTWNVVQSFTGGGYTHAIAFSPVNKSNMAVIHVDGNDYRTIWVSTNSGLNWVKKAGLGNGYQWGNISFSAINANTLYMGMVELHKSTDLGATFGPHITSFCCSSNGIVAIHGDFNDIKINPLNKKMYLANDGGLAVFDESVSPYGTASWKELSNSLIVSHYFAMGTSQVDPAMYGGAGMDNGAWVHKTDGNWMHASGGDCGTVVFDPKVANAFYTVWGYFIDRGTTTTNWGNPARISNNIPNRKGQAWVYVEPIAIDPNDPNVIVTGMYTDVWKSTNKGDTWTNIGPNLAGGDNLRGVAIAPSNSNVIYEHCHGKLFTTKNDGTNWSTYSFPGNTNPEISSFAVHSTKPGTIWVSHNNWSAGNKVFKSTDYGVTWTNESGSLPNLPVTSIVYDKSTDGIYVSMYYGVYYKNSTMSDWVNFSQGLPNAQIGNIVVQNSAKKLRCATLGRGFWETDLYSTTTSIANNITEQAAITIYPNPTNGEFTLEVGFPDNGSYNLEIVNLLGQAIYHEALNINNTNYNYTKKFSLTELPKGIYYIKLNGNNRTEIKKIIIE